MPRREKREAYEASASRALMYRARSESSQPSDAVTSTAIVGFRSLDPSIPFLSLPAGSYLVVAVVLVGVRLPLS
jgi:hypothetical protein